MMVWVDAQTEIMGMQEGKSIKEAVMWWWIFEGFLKFKK